MCKPFPSHLTNKEIFRHCLHTVRSFTAKNKDSPPHILILGTHRDKLKMEKDKLKEIQKSVRSIVEEAGVRGQMIWNGDDYVFPINAKDPGEEDMKCAKVCRDCLNKGIEEKRKTEKRKAKERRKADERRKTEEGRKAEEGREDQKRRGDEDGRKDEEEEWRLKVPLRWYAMEYVMQEVAKELQRDVLRKAECLEIANSLHIDEESFEEALKFFSALNLLFYWPEILPELVFVKTQVILDKVSEMVEESFLMKNHKSGHAWRGEWQEFKDYAKVTKHMMLERFKKHYVDEMFTPKELTTLFENLLVFAKLSNDSWFMPSLLNSTKEAQEYRASTDKALVVHFPDSKPLIGMFCCMVAFVLSPDNKSGGKKYHWKVYEVEGKPKCLTRNVIMFQFKGLPVTVTMINLYTHFEVYVKTCLQGESQVWQVVRTVVFTGLWKASEILGYTLKAPEAAIVCLEPYSDEHKYPPHHASINDKGEWICSKDNMVCGNRQLEMIPWWQNSKKHNPYVQLLLISRTFVKYTYIWQPCLSVASE